MALLAVLMSLVAMAQAPQKMTYQAVVRDNNGQLVSNGNVGVRITIVRGSETGTEVYSQTETVHTNDNGLFTTMIGGTGFDAIDWGNGPYYLKSEVDPDGGTNYILTTTQQMVSVPYALHAGTVDSIIGGVNFTETDPIFNAWNKDYNDLINRPTIPTNVSELTNDAGYLTSFTETQVLSISNDTIYLTGGSYVKLPAGFSGDYNDLTNRPNLADSVSRIVNEYHLGDTIINYISQNGYVDSSYVINYNTQQGYVDTSYVTNYINNIGGLGSENDPVFTAWDKDYNDLINKPTIPTVPTNVSEFTNDAGYLTSFTEAQVLSISNDTIYLTGGSYVKLPAGFSGDYNDLTNKPTIPTVPTNVSEFTNDAGYITSANVPTNVSEFTNDAGYLTSFTEAQVLSIGHDTIYLTGGSYVKLPAGFSGDYNDLTNKPTIPTVPTNVSEFTNDAGYLTSFTEAQVLSIGHDTIYLTGGSYVKLPAGFSGDYNDLTNKPTIPTVPTNVSEFTNDAGYLTSFTEAQVLSIGHDTIYLTGGSYVKLPAGFSGDYNDLTNKPTIPTVPTNVSEFTNDAGYLTSFTEAQVLSTGHDTIYLTGGSYVKLPAGFSGNYNDLTNKPTIPTVPTNVSEFTNDAGYLTSYTETQNLSDVAAIGNEINAQVKNVTDPTDELDAVNFRTLNAVITELTHKLDSITHIYDSLLGIVNGVSGVPPVTAFDDNGATHSLFSVGKSKKVRFSRGNLRYSASEPNWSFATQQYSTLNTSNSETMRDLFPWGIPDLPNENSGNLDNQGWVWNINDNPFRDWGKHPIHNGGNTPFMWRTLRSAEWFYLLFSRSTSTVGGTANARYAAAEVNGINGIVIFPDIYTHPNGVAIPMNINVKADDYSSNTYSDSEWTQMELAGAVFLPVTGYGPTGVNNPNSGNYWTADLVMTYIGASCKYRAGFISFITNDGFDSKGGFGMVHGGQLINSFMAVRLVQDAN